MKSDFFKKKVLFYVYELPPLGGGVGRAAESLLKQFAKSKDLKIDVITTSLKNKTYQIQNFKNIRIHYLNLGIKSKNLHKQSVFEMFKFWWVSYFYTWKLIRSGKKFDLTHTFGYPGGLISFLFSFKWPYLISLRGVDVPGYNPKFNLYYPIYKILTFFVWKLARFRITNSQWLKELAKKNLDLDFLVIPNGVDTDFFKPKKESEKINLFTVTAGGSILGPKKNLDLLISAFGIFHKKFPSTQLLLIGQGSEEKKLNALAKELSILDSIKFVGYKSTNYLKNTLPKCHVMCLPSVAEGMSNAILEAMACGLPIVTTTPSTELVKGNGIVLENPDSQELAKAFEKIYLDKNIRIKMGNFSRKIAESMSWEKVAGEYKKIYFKI